MTTENRFNLIDEPWIPVVDVGKVSLKQIFSNKNYRGLAGNPVQKIALTKLLLAIAQAAYTPSDDEDWAALKVEGMAKKCLEYLDKWHDHFWLYGERPFLQMPVLANLIEIRKNKELKGAKGKLKQMEITDKAKPKAIGLGFYPDLPTDNNTILTQFQISHSLDDSEKAVFIVSLMNFAFGGKRVEKDLDSLTPAYTEKSNSAKAGPSLGNHDGYLHSYLCGAILLDTLWFNILTTAKIGENKIWVESLGVPPWELMPTGEGCTIANNLKNSYMGCLVALSRFVLLVDDGIYYVEGIQYPSHKKGWREPSMAINDPGKDVNVLWVKVDKKPWRQLTALLSFINATSQQGYDCQQIRYGLMRARLQNKIIGIWSGGLKVTNNSGDQSVKKDDDFVESEILLPTNETLKMGDWFEKLRNEMDELDKLDKIIKGTTLAFFKIQMMDGKEQAKIASNLFWQLCERKFQKLVNACGNINEVKTIRKTFAQYVYTVYDTFCPKETARQLDAWAKCRPNLHKYLS